MSRPMSWRTWRAASRNGSDSMSPTVPPISVITTSTSAPAHRQDPVLDLVGDVRDHLDGVAEVVAAALLGDHLGVDLTGGDVGDLAEVGVEEPLVVADVEVGLGAVVGDEDLAVLERVHRPGIDVEVGVELLHGHAETARLQQAAEAGGRQPLAERGGDASGDEYVLGGRPSSRGSILPERDGSVRTRRTERAALRVRERIRASVAVTCPRPRSAPSTVVDVAAAELRTPRSPARSPASPEAVSTDHDHAGRLAAQTRTSARRGRRRRCRRPRTTSTSGARCGLPSGLTVSSSAPARPAGSRWRASADAGRRGRGRGHGSPRSWPIREYVGGAGRRCRRVELGHQLAAERVDQRLLARVDQRGLDGVRRRRPVPPAVSTWAARPADGLRRRRRAGSPRRRGGRPGRRRTAAAAVARGERVAEGAATLGGRLVAVGRRGGRPAGCGRPRRAGRRPATIPTASARKTATSETMWWRNEITRTVLAGRRSGRSASRPSWSAHSWPTGVTAMAAARAIRPASSTSEQVPRPDPAGVERRARRAASTRRGPTLSRVR